MPCGAGSRWRARPLSTSSMSDRREVSRRDVADDLVDRRDLVLPQPCRVLPNELLRRGVVDAERPHQAGVVDYDVAVLPGDRGEVTLGQLSRAPADSRHLGLPHIECTYDHVARHGAHDIRTPEFLSRVGSRVMWSAPMVDIARAAREAGTVRKARTEEAGRLAA